MKDYIVSLNALLYLLRATKVNFWADWVSKDIEFAYEGKVEHHLSAYGGMGSFNDLIICKVNGHDVTEEQEPWVNCLLQVLKGLCYTLARTEHKIISSDIIDKAFWMKPKNIQGWRCLTCGYGQLTSRDIDGYLAPIIIKQIYDNKRQSEHLITIIDDVLSGNIKGIKSERESIMNIALKSNIAIREKSINGMRPCPRCNGNDTAVYRWDIQRITFGRTRMVPSKDNLKLRI